MVTSTRYPFSRAVMSIKNALAQTEYAALYQYLPLGLAPLPPHHRTVTSTRPRSCTQEFEFVRIRFDYISQITKSRLKLKETNTHNTFNKLQASHSRWKSPTA